MGLSVGLTGAPIVTRDPRSARHAPLPFLPCGDRVSPAVPPRPSDRLARVLCGFFARYRTREYMVNSNHANDCHGIVIGAGYGV